MTKIIAIGGKKKSGKGLAGTYLSGLILSSRGAIPDFKLNVNNDDHCLDIVNGKKNTHINNIDTKTVKIYGFADKLKEICASIFNIEPSLLAGNEEKKNSKTHIKWRDVPGIITDQEYYNKLIDWQKRAHRKYGRRKFGELPSSIQFKQDDYVTVRELLQYFGSDICRSMYSYCWSDALKQQIKHDNPEFAIVVDLRFDNEFFSLKSDSSVKCLSILLMRDINNNQDKHKSENGFSPDLPWDIKIDNRANTAPEMCKNLIERVAETNILKPNDSN